MKDGETRHLGTFATPEEAALHYARHIGVERAAAEASSSSSSSPSAFTCASSAAAEASSSSQPGFTGTQMTYKGPGKYVLWIWENGSVRTRYTFATKEEMFLFEARHVEAERAAAAAVRIQLLAEEVAALVAAPPPLTAEEARAATAAEGIVPASSGETSGFGGA